MIKILKDNTKKPFIQNVRTAEVNLNTTIPM